MAAFGSLEVNVNEGGWGPCGVCNPKFVDIPFAPFSKNDRLGKAADWMQAPHHGRNRDRQGFGAEAGPFSLHHAGDEESFHVVDNRPVQKPKFHGNRQRFNPNYRGHERRRDERQERGPQTKGKRPAKNDRYNRYDRRWEDQQQQQREPSLEVGQDWTQIAQVAFSELQKLSAASIPEGKTIKKQGNVQTYNKQFDRLSTKMDRRLQRYGNTVLPKGTASSDPFLNNLGKKGEGTVFATDEVIAALMTTPRSVVSWDVVVTKKGNTIFLDKRPESALGLVLVNETANSAPVEDGEGGINAQSALATEATLINQNFFQMVVGNGKDGKSKPGYLYRQFELGDETLVVRCDVDALSKGRDNNTQLVSIKALNEYDSKISGVNWRKQLDSQRGALIATEMRNNTNKLARWCAMSLLAEHDLLKVGFVSRITPKDPFHHTILGTQYYKPTEFAAQMNLKVPNTWGILNHLIGLVRKNEGDGKFIFLKDPNKTCFTLYSVPSDTEMK